MQKDLTTLLAERDAQQHKAELEKLREENLRLLQQVSDKIDNADAKITESAIIKTMAVLDHTRKWILGIFAVLAFIIALAGVIGITGISSKMTAIVTDKVNGWLRFEDSNSGSYKVMDDLRTRALLDALTLRYAREKARGDITQPRLNQAEKQRLMSIILNPSSDEYQFRDALDLIIASRGMFGMVSEDETGKKIADILGNNDFNNAKKVAVLNAMQRERALYPLTLQILVDQSGRYDENILMDAFANVRQFDEKRARQFAEEPYGRVKSAHNRTVLAEYLIDIGADNSNIDRLIGELRQQQRVTNDVWNGNYQTLIFSRIAHGLKSPPADLAPLAHLIATQIDNGLQMDISDFSTGKPYLHFSLDRSSQAFSQPDSLLNNGPLINAIIRAEPLTVSRLQKMSDFFQTTDRGLWITTLMMKPSEQTKLKLDSGDWIRGDNVLDYIWLRVVKKAGQPSLIASWREKTGKAHEGEVVDLTGAEKARFHVDFNRQQVMDYTWRDPVFRELY